MVDYKDEEYRKLYCSIREFLDKHAIEEFMQILMDVLHSRNAENRVGDTGNDERCNKTT